MASDNVDVKKKITPEELAKHATAKDCWLLIDGIVYDVTKYLDNHPGGSAVMVEHAGQDCTENFEDIGARPMLSKLFQTSHHILHGECRCFVCFYYLFFVWITISRHGVLLPLPSSRSDLQATLEPRMPR
jgi:predicted heme/steroid binding protein